MSSALEVQTIRDGLLFDAAIELWGFHRATLGLFPRGAFEDRARAGGLMGATIDGALVGYIAFRVTYDRCTIVHLCVNENARGRGVARRLFRAMCEALPQTVMSVRAVCRRDYAANAMWARLQFRCLGQRPGRGNPPALLDHWACELPRRSLFSALERRQSESETKVAIDAHVFFDLIDESRTRSEESIALVQDWASAELAVYVTDELFNEIRRNPNQADRDRLRQSAESFPRLKASVDAFDDAHRAILKVMGLGSSDSDASDRRHLAYAVAAGALVFATRDASVLQSASRLYDELGINVVHPGEVFLRLAEMDDEARYRPGRLAGTLLEHASVRAGEIDKLAEGLLPNGSTHDRGFLRSVIRDAIASKRSTASVIRSSGTVLALITNEARDDELEVTHLNVRQAALAPTLVRHLLAEEIRVAATRGFHQIRVNETVAAEHSDALSELGFFECDGVWRKLIGPVVVDAPELLDWLERQSERAPNQHCATLLAAVRRSPLTPELAASIESYLWPTLIVGAGIRSWIIPIKPTYAAHLFDRKMAEQDLFGARTDLALNYENVYYRRPKNDAGLGKPGRIFWYVSQGSGAEDGSMAIRAFSRLDEVSTGTAKEIFRTNRRLGVYAWRDVLERAGGPFGEIMAIRFSMTQSLTSPISFQRAQTIVAAGRDTAPTFQSPLEITDVAVRQMMASGAPRG